MFKIPFLLLILIICSTFNNVKCQSTQQPHGNQQIKANTQFSQQPRQMDGEMSRSQKIKVEQRQRFNKAQRAVASQTQFNELLFTVQGVQQFIINLPVAQQVAISMFTYVMVQNTYMRPRDIQNEPSLRVFIFQNNNKLIHQQQFYFQSYIVFDGKQQSTYTIRFINPGRENLITMNLKKITQLSHVQKVIDKKAVQVHAQKAHRINQQLKFLLNAFERYYMINMQTVKYLFNNLGFYYYWNLFQIILSFIVCILQVMFIKRVFKQTSII